MPSRKTPTTKRAETAPATALATATRRDGVIGDSRTPKTDAGDPRSRGAPARRRGIRGYVLLINGPPW
jgi:hypothetical protein